MGYIFDAIKRADRAAPQPGALPSSPTDGFDGPFVAAVTRQNEEEDQPAAAAAPSSTSAQAEAVDESAIDPPNESAGEPPEPLCFPTDFTEGEEAANLDDRMVTLTAADSAMAEEYRSIRTAMLARGGHKRHLIHTITSATPQEGKTITSLNLGLSFGELRNRSIVVIEADLRLPTFADLLHLEDGPGLVHHLRGEAALGDIMRRIEGSRLCVIPAGVPCGADAIQLLSGHRMAELLKTLRTKFDHVIVDTPPVTELADAGILGTLSDEVLMVVRMGRTPRPLVEQAIRTLQGYHAPVTGIIATDQQRSGGRYSYRYGYRYQYQHRRAA